MSSIVVTGASGFLAGEVVRQLRTQGRDVIAVSRKPRAGCVQVDTYSQLPAGDILVHLAEERDRAQAENAGKRYLEIAQQTLKDMLSKRWRRIIYSSSAVLYGDTKGSPSKVEDSTHALDIYTSIKQFGEETVLETGAGVVARLANVYGPGMAKGNVVSTILDQVETANPLEIWDGRPIRDFVWISDAAAAIVAMTSEEEASYAYKGVYNVGSGEGISIADLAHLALKVVGRTDVSVKALKPQKRSSYLVLDIEDTMRTWGWHPRVSLLQGITCLLNENKLEKQYKHD